MSESALPRYVVRMEAEGTRQGFEVRAASMEEAVAQARAKAPSPELRPVEICEQNESAEQRQQKIARRRYLNTIIEAGLSALGKSEPEHVDEPHFEVLRDFFTRAVVLPGHQPFPAGENDSLLGGDDGALMADLLMTHLAHHGLRVVARAE